MNNQLLALVATILLIGTMGCGCSKSNSSASSAESNSPSAVKNGMKSITYIQDISHSADTSLFQEQIEMICGTLATNIKRGYLFNKIEASGDLPVYNSPIKISPRAIKETCPRKKISTSYGTKTEPSFQLGKRAVLEAKGFQPILLIHIDSNEGEINPTEVWQDVVASVIERNGFVLIFGASNRGAENFNQQLLSALGGISNEKVKFATESAEIRSHLIDALR